MGRLALGFILVTGGKFTLAKIGREIWGVCGQGAEEAFWGRRGRAVGVIMGK